MTNDTTTRETVHVRTRAKRPLNGPPEKLFRFNASTEVVQSMLENDNLSKEDIIAFLEGRDISTECSQDSARGCYDAQIRAYRQRREEIDSLIKKLPTGGASIDEHGRLVENDQNRVVPPPRMDLPPIAPPGPFLPGENLEEERRWLEQEERHAAADVLRALERYRIQGVPEDDLELVPIAHPSEQTSLTMRRIIFAVVAVTIAFICILFQALPLFHSRKVANKKTDHLVFELFKRIKALTAHEQECPGLTREYNLTFRDHIRKWYGGDIVDCSNGVLHIPAMSVIVDEFVKAKTMERTRQLEPFVKQGINHTWFLPCRPPRGMTVDSAYPGAQGTCGNPSYCFRGVHDDFTTEKEMRAILRMGSHLILSGGDHFDIHDNIRFLHDWIPSVLEKLRGLLESRYDVQSDIEPVAFRISAVGPVDGSNVPLYGVQASNYLVRIVNVTNYVNFMTKSQRINEMAQFSLPWPFRIQPVRDPCNLIADLEVDPRYAIHTSIFLSNGAGVDFRGGASLYVDHHIDNSNPRRKIQRGLTIDGTTGRLVVSSGGIENRRCRLPTRAGIRAALQIWWASA